MRDARVLEITPYEPPASGWINRVKLLRKIIEEGGGQCEVLDIGPNRRIERPGCITVLSGSDFIKKVNGFARSGFNVHCHINGEYFRGMLLALAAAVIARVNGRLCITTMHAGTDQMFFRGWKNLCTWPFYRVIFLVSNTIICNSEAVKHLLRRYGGASKTHAIRPFSAQYLDFEPGSLGKEVDNFVDHHDIIVSTYLCFRDGFYFDTFIEAAADLAERMPGVGIVVAGTGDDPAVHCDPSTLKSLKSRLIFSGNLAHDQFLTLMQLSAVHVRTPTTDGVSATVMEALSLGTPVVASENGNRPNGVITYEAADKTDLADKLEWALRNLDEAQSRMPIIDTNDTAQEEVNLLIASP